jgi:hypothetical protein
VDSISQEEFERAYSERPTLAPWLIERRWFRHNDRFGVILYDTADHDWSFVVIGRINNEFRALDAQVSLKSERKAFEGLSAAIQAWGIA